MKKKTTKPTKYTKPVSEKQATEIQLRDKKFKADKRKVTNYQVPVEIIEGLRKIIGLTRSDMNVIVKGTWRNTKVPINFWSQMERGVKQTMQDKHILFKCMDGPFIQGAIKKILQKQIPLTAVFITAQASRFKKALRLFDHAEKCSEIRDMFGRFY